ncbi:MULTISPECIES: AraC family transcriptional regulator [unclassified Chelatococcus]|uniref:helix-turn-helix transcriptional regulator n=1 Tax=unclassified Chelatococcus TaxID=2638111 RepID=UPI001BCBEA90|nr:MULTISPECIES: AraC family transcriptional regulator [unclassified Chelatococcus]CAH1652680.1 HTH araC/xylS-type domain-containing protein [Hyphomicrobiales bacterium]MBS7743000.1 helix-turn-helix transcriptional regulator [Chelatococcus sp. HY11]MBX3541882.1 helix-turn-helix transcriptional regulator [Chelatococcus sp.]MCO5074227.1 AraC family transcriptional regulator [Chelatococcus sp.]CAH1693990.1 HTH araC/xylS-type domain-containing protein [Hyphomicrobiales bacterium]
MSLQDRGEAPQDESSLATRPYHFSTRDLAPQHQFDAWRSFMASSIELSQPEGQDVGFAADLYAWDLGSLAFTEMAMPGNGATRSFRHRKAPPTDHWCLVLPFSEAEHAVAINRPGNRLASRRLSFRSIARPYAASGTDSHVISLFIPRDHFGEIANLLDATPHAIPDQGLGSILADFMQSVERQLPHISADNLPRLVDAILAMIRGCLVPTPDNLEMADIPLSAMLLERARQTIRRNVHAPDLSPDQLCRQLGVSRSRLYRLFENLGGVSSYIRRQRLLAAHAVLSDVSQTRQIRQIAESVGFTDASAFTRAFNTEFGCSPGDVRAAALAGHRLSPFASPRATNTEADFNRLLVRLHA